MRDFETLPKGTARKSWVTHFDAHKDNERAVAFHRRFGPRDAGEDHANFYYTYSRADYKRTRKRDWKSLPDELRVESA